MTGGHPISAQEKYFSQKLKNHSLDMGPLHALQDKETYLQIIIKLSLTISQEIESFGEK